MSDTITCFPIVGTPEAPLSLDNKTALAVNPSDLSQ